MSKLVNFWNSLFFSDSPTLTICVFRLLTGILILIETRNSLLVYKRLLSPNGWFNYDDYKQRLTPSRFSLLNYLPATIKSVELVLCLQCAAGILLLVGIQSGLAALICFITLVSVHNRNPYAVSSGESLYRFYCLFLIFAPSETQLSILDFPHLLHPEVRAYPWPLLMVKGFMANIYLQNVFYKLHGHHWPNGTATQQALNVRIYSRFTIPPWLKKNWFYKVTTFTTLAIEIALCTLIWVDDFRLPVVCVGILFHLGLWCFLRIGFFQIAMIFGLTTFVTSEEYAFIFARVKQLWL